METKCREVDQNTLADNQKGLVNRVLGLEAYIATSGKMRAYQKNDLHIPPHEPGSILSAPLRDTVAVEEEEMKNEIKEKANKKGNDVDLLGAQENSAPEAAGQGIPSSVASPTVKKEETPEPSDAAQAAAMAVLE